MADAGAGEDGEEAARWTVLPQPHDPPVLPQAQRCTVVGAGDETATAGSGIRITAAATAVASRSAGSCGDETGSVDSRCTDRATNWATPRFPRRGWSGAADRWADEERSSAAGDAGRRSGPECCRATVRSAPIYPTTFVFAPVTALETVFRHL